MRTTLQLVLAARALLGPDVVLEAELGGLAGDEDRAFGADQSGVSVAGLTDSAQVEDFVSRTGAELLAVAVGNVHGKYKGEPQLRWDVLQDIAVRTHIPLVLHGASGIPAEELVKARGHERGQGQLQHRAPHRHLGHPAGTTPRTPGRR